MKVGVAIGNNSEVMERPGQKYDEDEQCFLAFGTSACEEVNSIDYTVL